MSKREINIVLRAKNAMSAGLAKAGKSLEKFGQSAKRIGGFFAKTFLAAGAALAGFAAKAIHSYAQLERDTAALAASIDSFGESSGSVIPALREQAKAIQDVTGQTHAQTFAVMNMLKLQGVATEKLADATKGVMALKRAGMAEEAAARAMAAATMGNFQALTRYIPALRVAADESDKLRIVNEFLARGYAATQDELDTVAGQWANLKGRVGDVWEEIGRALAQNDQLTNALKRASEAVRAFGERVAEWAGRGGVQNLIMGVRAFYEDARGRFLMLGSNIHMVFATVSDAADTAFRYLGNVVRTTINANVAQFQILTRTAGAVFEFLQSRSRESFRAIAREAEAATADAAQAYVDMAKAVAGSSGLVTKRTEAALSARAQIEQDLADRVIALQRDMADASQGAADDQVRAARDAIGDVVDASALAAAEHARLEAEKTKLTKEAEQARVREAADAARERISEARKELDANRQVAQQTVSAFLAAQRQQEREEQQWRRDQARAERLRGNRSAAAQRFVSAVDAISEARGGMGGLEAQVQAAEEHARALDASRNRSLEEITKELRAIHQDQLKLLAAG
jgi:hypothetical protein